MEPEGKRSSRRLDIVAVRYATCKPLAKVPRGTSSSRLIWEMIYRHDHDTIRIHAHFSLFLPLRSFPTYCIALPTARNITVTLIRARSHFLRRQVIRSSKTTGRSNCECLTLAYHRDQTVCTVDDEPCVAAVLCCAYSCWWSRHVSMMRR
jgi:hypothetical protein